MTDRQKDFAEFFSKYKSKFKQRKVLIWGAWYRGLDVQRALKQIGIDIAGYIDSNPMKKQYGQPEKTVTTADILKKEKYFVIVSLVDHTSVYDFFDECSYVEYEDYLYIGKSVEISGIKHTFRDEIGNSIKGDTGNAKIVLGGNSKIIIGKDVMFKGKVEIRCLWNSTIVINDGAVIEGGTLIVEDNSILELGKNVRLHSNYYVSIIKCAKTRIGNFATLGSGLDLRVHEYSEFSCGEDCMFSYDIKIRANHGHGIIDRKRNIVKKYNNAIKIGSHVWVGMGGVILAGTEIGAHSMVGAGSIVNKKFPDYVTLAGNPAKIIKEDTDWIRENPYPDREYSINECTSELI